MERDSVYVGQKVGVVFGREPLLESGTVTMLIDGRAQVRLDNTVELPDHLGGGWCIEVEREFEELEPLGGDRVDPIEVVARQVLLFGLDQVEWEDFPDIGEHDWGRVVAKAKVLADAPEQMEFDRAYMRLAEQAEKAGGN